MMIGEGGPASSPTINIGVGEVFSTVNVDVRETAVEVDFVIWCSFAVAREAGMAFAVVVDIDVRGAFTTITEVNMSLEAGVVGFVVSNSFVVEREVGMVVAVVVGIDIVEVDAPVEAAVVGFAVTDGSVVERDC